MEAMSFTLLIIAVFCLYLSPSAQLSLDGQTMAKRLDQFAADMGKDFLQKSYDQTPAVEEPLEGHVLVTEIARSIGGKFTRFIDAALKLRENVQRRFREYKTQTNFKTCCKLDGSTLEYDIRFKKKVDLHTVCKRESDTAYHTPRYPDASLEQQMAQNLAEVPNLKWQYFGTEEGVHTSYPAKATTSCTSFDPRYRPWYAEAATPTPKDVVLVIDVSGSMMDSHAGRTLLDIVKEAAKTVLDTLNPRDRVGLVTFSHIARTPSGTPETSNCYSNTVAQATPHNIKYLKKYIEEIISGGGTKYIPALEQAFELLKSCSGTKVLDRVILFLTDGEPYESKAEILAAIHKENQALNNSVIVKTYGTGQYLKQDAEDILSNMAQQTGFNSSYGNVTAGLYTYIKNPDDLRRTLGSYYNFFSKRTRSSSDFVITIPYADFSGLGLVTTIAAPVYHNDTFKGVVGVDLSMSDLLSDVTYFKQGAFSYAFIIDNIGRTMMHPLLPRPYSVEEPPIFLDIGDLESSREAEEMIESMKRGKTGSKSYMSTHVLSRGDAKRDGVSREKHMTSFFWHPIEGTNFSVCIAIAGDNKQTHLPPLKLQSSDTFLYYDLHLKKPKTSCKHFSRLATNASSCVKFSPSAFRQPYNYLESNESINDIDRYEMYLRGLSPKNPGLKSHVRSSVAKTSVLDSFWLRHQSNNTVWRYFGTEEGVFRIHPAATLSKNYDHFQRDWYKKAVSYPGLNVMSAPYFDALGAGLMVTMARTIFHGRKTGELPDNDLIAGVLGADFTLQSFYSLMIEAHEPCSGRNDISCLLMDQSGYLVMHDDFVNNNSAVVENVHIIDKEPFIAKALIDRNILEKSVCVNYETVSYQVTWRVVMKRKSFELGASRGNFVMEKVQGSNVYLIKYQKTDGSVDCKCQENYASCESASPLSCECPCSRPAAFSYCDNRFYVTSTDIAPCSPRAPLTHYKAVDESKIVATLGRCYDMECHSRSDKRSCFGVAGCQWCDVGACVYSEETCPSESLSAGAMVGICFASAAILVAIIMIAVMVRRRLQKRSDVDNQVQNHHIRSPNHIYAIPETQRITVGYEEPVARPRIHEDVVPMQGAHPYPDVCPPENRQPEQVNTHYPIYVNNSVSLASKVMPYFVSAAVQMEPFGDRPQYDYPRHGGIGTTGHQQPPPYTEKTPAGASW